MLDRSTIERMSAKAGAGPILIALSGGGDSTALLHVLSEAVGAKRLHAVVVDHGLREGSAADAARALTFAAAMGVNAQTLRIDWNGCPPANTGGPGRRSQQAARAARYALLCDAARRVGARVVATAHSRDDQAETVLLRARRGSGWRGLAGMRAFSPLPLWPEGRGLYLARPLLARRRAELRAYLQARGAAWIEDPANANDAYARVRARRALAELAANGFDPMRLAVLAERIAPHAEALDAAAAALIVKAAAFEAGVIKIRREAWRSGDAVRQRALAALLAAAGGAERSPGDEQVAVMDAQMHSANFRAATLSGCLLGAGREGWTLTRDRGALVGRADGVRPPAPLPLAPNAWTVWDRRLAFRSSQSGWSVMVQDGTPFLANDGERRTIDEVASRWLLAERAGHLLGRAN